MENDSTSFFPYLPEVLGGKARVSDSYELPFEIFSYKEMECIKNEKISLEATVLKLMQDLQEKSKQLDRVTYYLDSIVKNINEGLIFVNHTGIITTFNAAAEKIFQGSGRRMCFSLPLERNFLIQHLDFRYQKH
jgi:PAS domain-containing protein